MMAPSSSVAMTETVRLPSTIGVKVHDWPTWPSEHPASHRISTGADGFSVSISLPLVTKKVIGLVTMTSSLSVPIEISGGRLSIDIVDWAVALSLSPSVIDTSTENEPSSGQDHSKIQSSSMIWNVEPSAFWMLNSHSISPPSESYEEVASSVTPSWVWASLE